VTCWFFLEILDSELSSRDTEGEDLSEVSKNLCSMVAKEYVYH